MYQKGEKFLNHLENTGFFQISMQDLIIFDLGDQNEAWVY